MDNRDRNVDEHRVDIRLGVLPQTESVSRQTAICITQAVTPVNAACLIISRIAGNATPSSGTCTKASISVPMSAAARCGRMLTVNTAARSPKNRVLWFTGRE